jgi:hypothetical protein
MLILVDLERVDSVGILEEVLIGFAIVLEEGEFKDRIQDSVVFGAFGIGFVSFFLKNSFARGPGKAMQVINFNLAIVNPTSFLSLVIYHIPHHLH